MNKLKIDSLKGIKAKHSLKTWPEYFEYVYEGEKTFEIRKNDRDYRINQIIVLEEYDPHNNTYTGRWVKVIIAYITDFEQKPEYVVFGFMVLEKSTNK